MIRVPQSAIFSGRFVVGISGRVPLPGCAAIAFVWRHRRTIVESSVLVLDHLRPTNVRVLFYSSDIGVSRGHVAQRAQRFAEFRQMETVV